MERIENILRRIQELYYSKHEKTGIDIDLMLDYTRVMYADLLEWRKRFKDAPAENHTAAPVTTAEADAQPIPVSPQQEAAAATAPLQAKAPENTPDQVQEAPPAAVEEIRVAGPEKEEAEAEVIQEVLHNNSSAISFEPPAPKLPHVADIDDALIEEDPVTNTPVEDIVLPEIEAAPQPVSPPKVNPVVSGNGPSLKKDIRGAIGINDKYLFLNELFANNKTDYEEALDQLRLFDNYEEAYAWLHTHPSRKNGWEEGDDTVQSFLNLVSQYFASR